MKHSMTFLFCLFFWSSLSLAQVPDLPIEVVIIFDTLKGEKLNSHQQQRLRVLQNDLEQYSKQIPKDTFFLMAKSEVYKGLFELTKDQQVGLDFVSIQNVEALNNRLKINKEKLHPFGKWIFEAFLKDLTKLTDSPYYKNKALVTSQTQIFEVEKRAKILAPWLKELLTTDPEVLNEKLVKKQFQLLERISRYIKYYVITTHLKSQITLVTPSFPSSSNNEATESKNSSESVASEVKILEEILQATPTSTPKPQTKSWVPKD